MKYDYKCDKCGKVTEITLPMKDDKPKTIDCKCGGKAYQDFSSIMIFCPASMRA